MILLNFSTSSSGEAVVVFSIHWVLVTIKIGIREHVQLGK